MYYQQELARKTQQLNDKQNTIDELEREIDSIHTEKMKIRK